MSCNKNKHVLWLSTLTRSGPEQMALDEAILLATAKDQQPRFRFYYWSVPTISLGYFQDYNNFLSAFPNFSSFPIVRRLTGGGAILHDKEITYCLTLPAEHELYKQGPIAAYVLMHEAIAEVLKPLGINLQLRPKDPDYARVRGEPEFCFARPCPTDLICTSGKLVGSAQRRLPKAFMQHGSIMLENRFTEQPTAAVSKLITPPPDPADLEKSIAKVLERRMNMELVRRELTPEDMRAMHDLIDKYAGSEWTAHRKALNQ